VRPKGWKLGFTLLVPETVIPEGMGSHVALIEPGSSLEGGGLVQLQTFPKDFYGGIPPRHRALLGRVILPYEPASLSERSIATELKRTLQRIETVIPFLRQQPFSMFPDPDNLERDPVFQRFYRFCDPTYIPGSLLVYDSTFGGGDDPAAFLDWSRFGLDGLALCSRDIRPLQGVFGEIVSAMELLKVWDRRKSSRPSAAAPGRRPPPPSAQA
jgi:hypothetical protein